MVLVGVILNTYGLLNDNKQINKVAFNNILLKSAVVSFAILIVLVVSNYKKFKAINKE